MSSIPNHDEIFNALPRVPDEVLRVPQEALLLDLKSNPVVMLLMLVSGKSGEGRNSTMIEVLKSHPLFPQALIAQEAIERGKRIEELETQVATLLAKYEPIEIPGLTS